MYHHPIRDNRAVMQERDKVIAQVEVFLHQILQENKIRAIENHEDTNVYMKDIS